MNVQTGSLTGGLNGHQKVAILCMALGPEAAAEITRQLSSEDVQSISAEIARMDSVAPEVTHAVLTEWEQVEVAAQSTAGSGPGYARQILEKAFGGRRASAIIGRIGGAEASPRRLFSLDDADPKQLRNMLRTEHPQTIAVVLVHMDQGQTAAVLEEFDPELGAEILHRMAAMRKVSPDMLKIVADSLKGGMDLYLSGDMSAAGGPDSVAAILNRVGGSKDRALLSSLAERDATVSDEIRNLMFVFEDLAKVDKRSLQALIQNVDSKELALGLKVASDALREKIESVMSQRALSSLKDEMEFLGPVRVSEVEEAQQNIVNLARSLEEAGDIVLGGSEDDKVIE